MQEEHREQLREIINFHDRFAVAFKLVEDFVNKMDATSLNDIRYALRAVVDCVRAALNEDDDKFQEHYSICMTALRIAWHDVVDITVKEFKVFLDEMSKKYDADIVAKHLDIKAAREVVYLAEDKSREARGDRDRRVELYEEISNDHLKTLLDCYRTAIGAEPAMLAEKRKVRRTLILSCIGLVVAVIVGSFVVGNIVYGHLTSQNHQSTAEQPKQTN